MTALEYTFAVAILVIFWVLARHRKELCAHRARIAQIGEVDILQLLEHVGEVDEGLSASVSKVTADHATTSIEAARLISELSTLVRNLDDRVRKLTPEDILSALATKEAWLDTANTRIDNAIGTARSMGQAAGEDAARTLVRQCIDNAIAGKGPPMQILRPDMSAGVLAAKIPKRGD